jgi:hypothetical protein
MGGGCEKKAAEGAFRSGADDLAGLQARGAHVQPLRGLADECVNRLDVGVPAARGAAVGVRNGHAESRPFAADIANSGHSYSQVISTS